MADTLRQAPQVVAEANYGVAMGRWYTPSAARANGVTTPTRWPASNTSARPPVVGDSRSSSERSGVSGEAVGTPARGTATSASRTADPKGRHLGSNVGEDA